MYEWKEVNGSILLPTFPVSETGSFSLCFTCSMDIQLLCSRAWFRIFYQGEFVSLSTEDERKVYRQHLFDQMISFKLSTCSNNSPLSYQHSFNPAKVLLFRFSGFSGGWGILDLRPAFPLIREMMKTDDHQVKASTGWTEIRNVTVREWFCPSPSTLQSKDRIWERVQERVRVLKGLDDCFFLLRVKHITSLFSLSLKNLFSFQQKLNDHIFPFSSFFFQPRSSSLFS